MNNRIALITDSCCDLPQSLTQRYGITVVPLSLNTRLPEPSTNQSVEDLNVRGFYQDLNTGLRAFTSAVSPQAFIDVMRPLLAAGTDVLYIGFSSALSATYTNACVAAQQLLPRFQGRKVYCVDSKSASLGQGLLVYLAAQQLQAGKSLVEVVEFAEQTAPRICHWFTVDNLKLLKHGGRMNATVASGSAMLHMKPLLHVDAEGRLVHVDKIRGRQAVMDTMLAKLDQYGEDLSNQTIMISYADCQADAMYLESRIYERYHPVEILINTISPVIAAHSGPKTLALFFLGKER